MIGIYTRSNKLYSKEFWKWLVRRLIRKYRGPNAVEDSLLRGLKELHIPFKRNVGMEDAHAIVLSGIGALREVIDMKKRGKIHKVVAGPNVVAHSQEAGGILLDSSIDIILVPSEWVADLWTHEAPEIADKLKVWPSGVAISKASTRRGNPVIYNKLGDEEMLKELLKVLGVEVRVFTYDAYEHGDYEAALSDAPYMVYLSHSESQGLALQEAWAHDVPTLVNKSTHWESGTYSWDAPQINCPYLTPELGRIFESTEELKALIEEVKMLHPKQYCDEYLSDVVCAHKLLKLL